MRLKVLFIATSNTGITWWRMYNPWVGMHRQGLADAHVLWYQKKLHETHPWEREIFDPQHQWRITKEIQDRFIQSDVIVFGMLHGPGIKIAEGGPNEYVDKSLQLFRAIVDIRNEMFPHKVILSEVDDNMVSTPAYNPAFSAYAPFQDLRNVALAQFKESDGIITSTPHLADVYSEFNPVTHVVPNAIDFKLWDKAERGRKPGIRIGWAGGANHDQDLKIIERVIPRMIAKHKDLKFVFIHGCPSSIRRLPGVEYYKAWTEIDDYPKMLARQDFDIGIAPLEDNSFNRGKSNLRWLEYSALGIPTVASNVGNFKETIRHMEDGFLAEENEFEYYLDALIKDKTLRRRVGNSARLRVWRDFNIDTVAQRYVETLVGEVGRRKLLHEAATA